MPVGAAKWNRSETVFSHCSFESFGKRVAKPMPSGVVRSGATAVPVEPATPSTLPIAVGGAAVESPPGDVMLPVHAAAPSSAKPQHAVLSVRAMSCVMLARHPALHEF